MDVEAFSKSPIGDVVSIQVEEAGKKVDHFAYVPHPLPELVDLTPATWATAIDAANQLGRLDAIATELLPNPSLLSRPTIRREAVSTSALEGTFAPAEEVLRSEVDEDRPRTPAVVEVLNFVRATDRGVQLIRTLPMCMRLARELQGILVECTSSDDWQRGKTRATQVIIGPYKGCSVLDAHYVPPPPGRVLEQGLDDWEHWLHSRDDIHPLVQIAMAHYQFESLHPFTDGNGRIGRLVAILQLIESGMLSEPLINLSPYLEANSDRYRYLLRDLSLTGDWNPWVSFFCDAVRAQANDAEVRIRELLAWRDDSLEMLKERRVKGVALDVTASLIEYPTLTVRAVAERHSVSVPSANNAVNRLAKFGVLEEVTGSSYNRVFQAPEVLDIFFRPSSRIGS